MDALKELFTTPVGLMSLGVIRSSVHPPRRRGRAGAAATMRSMPYTHRAQTAPELPLPPDQSRACLP